MVEEGNLFDPERPSLGSGLEALHQHLEALSSGQDTWDGHLDRPAGASRVGWAVPVRGGGDRGLRLVSDLGLDPSLVTSCPKPRHALGPSSKSWL